MNKNKFVVVTGGAGYVGSHVCIALIEEGYTPVIIDNLCNSDLSAVNRIKDVTGYAPEFLLADVCDRDSYFHIFASRRVYAVIHCAGFKSISDSIDDPLLYYSNNLCGTVTLLETMERYKCKRIVFSSTAAIYDEALRASESSPARPTTPYATTKLMIEGLLKDVHSFLDGWTVTSLRYFNPAGAHPSGLIGENPRMAISNLIPSISRIANNNIVNNSNDPVTVYGGIYETPDGTAMRDYIHVMDLAYSHTSVLLNGEGSSKVYNVGTGRAHTVLEVIEEFSNQMPREVTYVIRGRRKGDVEASFADYSLIYNEIGWEPKFTLKDIVRDQLLWENNNGQ